MSATNAAEAGGTHPSGFWKLVLGSVGVVYGDIGTSPLYALREGLSDRGARRARRERGHRHRLAAGLDADRDRHAEVRRADPAAPTTAARAERCRCLRSRSGRSGAAPASSSCSACAGAALFYGDAAITPAISVLSAVEGLELVAPHFDAYVLPITVAILVALFWVQSGGTARVSILFGPVTLVWFLVIAALGLAARRRQAGDLPGVRSRAAPSASSLDHGLGSLPVMGSVFLAVTGAEALYADMGHFGRGPIRTAWLGLVFPALALNYLGQGSLVLARPETADNPFFLMAPGWGLLPLVLLATCATVIASQAVISGAYSLTQQAVQLGLLPRLEIQHTSETLVGPDLHAAGELDAARRRC